MQFAGSPDDGHNLVSCLHLPDSVSLFCLEASGNYSLDLALTLQAHRQVEISVINPRRARRFAESLGQRSKTDPVDARVLCEYVARMPWVAWQPPSSVALHLRAVARAMADLGVIHTQQNNRARASAASQALPVLVVKEMQRHQKYLEQRMTRLRREALRLIAGDSELDRRFRLMLTTTGIAATSALANWPCSPTCWRRASGWPSADWIRGFSSQGNQSRSGLGSAGAVVVTCVVLSTCQRGSLCVAILICDASIKTY
jgi:transposase